MTMDLEAGIPGFRPDQLDGFRIAVTSDRRSEDLLAAFRRRGAEVTHAPTLRMTGVADDSVLIEETKRIIDGRPDVLLATTSYGMRRWLEAADAAGLGDELTDTLAAARILVRGRTVAVQLHGFTDPAQLARLTAAGATVLTVEPYRWMVHEDSERVRRLIGAVCSSGIDAITFTSAPAVDALFTIADGVGRLEELQAAMRDDVVVAAVGPVTATPLVQVGILPIVPDRFRMGALIRLTCEHLESTAVAQLDTESGPVQLRGKVVRVDGAATALSPVSLALFRTLVRAGGGTVSRSELARSAPEALDDHGVDVAVSRLRAALPDGRIVQTVIKRGYRIAVRS